jgi:hypothetical protein
VSCHRTADAAAVEASAWVNSSNSFAVTDSGIGMMAVASEAAT